jgi:hypothetical protein
MSVEEINVKPTATPIRDPMPTETFYRKQPGSFTRSKVFDSDTGANYLDSMIFDKRAFNTVVITIAETGGAQSVYFKILGCIDPRDWHELQGETSLAASGHIAFSLSDAWAFVKIQPKNNSGSGHVLAFIAGQTR